MNEFEEAALKYAQSGFSVLPLKPKDKIPIITSWTEFQQKRATPEQIHTWWGLWPKANIGIITGDISGVVVLDLDSREAAEEVKKLIPLNGNPIVSTGKGWHVYFRHTGERLNNRAAIRPGIDFRGDGGYVVAPPSIHPSGAVYRWIKAISGDMHDVPNNLHKLLKLDSSNEIKERFDTARAIAGLAQGERDQGVFRLACKLRGADVPYEIALSICEEAAANCDPPFLEARRKVDQAYKYQAGYSKTDITVTEQKSFWPEPVTVKDVKASTESGLVWIWDKAMPMGTTSMLAGEPRAGKSTLALNLSLAIARGVRFLGRHTRKAKGFYVSIDNSSEEMRELLNQIGVADTDNLMMHLGAVPTTPADWLVELIRRHSFEFVVVDTLQRFFNIREINNSDCATIMAPLDLAIKQLNCHLMYLHHASAKNTGEERRLSAFMGSTVIKGMCPYYFEYRRVGEGMHRILSSDLRNGRQFENTLVKIDPKTGWSVAAGTIEDAYVEDAQNKIIEFLKLENNEATESEIRRGLPIRGIIVSKALKGLYMSQTIERTGDGKRGAPFRYYLMSQLGGKEGSS